MLRAADEDDFEAIAAIVNHYILHTPIHFSYEVVTAAELRSSWEEQRARYPMLVAEVDGEIAGFSKAGPFRERAAYAWITECGVYLRPERIGRGLGEGLYRPLLEILREQGYHSAIGGIALPNEASVKLHERLGFAKVGHVARAGWKFERWHDVGFWQKDLAPAGSPAGEIRPPVVR
ncbi:MAG: GNAT family N-acetyltransferase [Minicystis sp.]